MSARSALLDGREVRRHRRLLGAGARPGDGSGCLLLAVALAGVLAAGCRSPRPAAIPAGMAAVSAPAPGELATLVWVGQGQAERFEGGAWRRAPEFDYEFSVEQHRYADRWESVKTMRRRHPGYDGSAGPRVQSYLFRLELTAGANPTEVDYQISSSLGKGRGRGDREFRKAVLELDADVSMFAPFDRYRITQDYQYEEGKLLELVELNDGASPWVRNREVALLFGATSYPAPPTRLGAAGTAADVEASADASAAASADAVALAGTSAGLALSSALRGRDLQVLVSLAGMPAVLERCAASAGDVRACLRGTLKRGVRRALMARAPRLISALRAVALARGR
ncbi:MAG: hypothetical protein IPI49_10605 [Myxococcales bacterium]|nr:hypothetical protein [Myxococcales bacterium]